MDFVKFLRIHPDISFSYLLFTSLKGEIRANFKACSCRGLIEPSTDITKRLEFKQTNKQTHFRFYLRRCSF